MASTYKFISSMVPKDAPGYIVHHNQSGDPVNAMLVDSKSYEDALKNVRKILGMKRLPDGYSIQQHNAK